MNGLAVRRREELAAKLSSLDAEFAYWKTQTEALDTGLRRHFTQVRRLAATLDGLLEPVRATIGALAAKPPGAVLQEARDCETDLLAAHAIWEVFRSKLVLRQTEHFRARLAAADDLAYACYAPAHEAFGGEPKSAPLVYLTSTWSPFARSRDASFLNEVRAGSGTSGALTGELFQEVLSRLPIPLVGLPWYQAFYVPGAILLAHEVGHVVEWDFGLTDAIAAALDGAGLEHADVWKGWASEMFADVYGCHAMGPAFAGALIDFLAGPIGEIAGEERRGGRYPTRALRVELAARVLARHGHDDAATRLRAAWRSTYGTMSVMGEFLAELDEVVVALCDGPYAGHTLADVIAFPHAERVVALAADHAGAGDKASLDGQTFDDPRLVFAAAQHIHENPGGRNLTRAYELLSARATTGGDHVLRFRPRGAPECVPPAAPTPEQLDAVDRRNGRALRALLTAAAAGPPPGAEPPDPPAP